MTTVNVTNATPWTIELGKAEQAIASNPGLTLLNIHRRTRIPLPVLRHAKTQLDLVGAEDHIRLLLDQLEGFEETNKELRRQLRGRL